MHAMTTTEIFLLAMLIIFTVPYALWRLARTDYWAPLVVVQIVAGILLGPGVMGSWFPEYYAFVFSPDVILALNGIAWWGVMLFVWIAGIELDLSQAWTHRRESMVTAGLAWPRRWQRAGWSRCCCCACPVESAARRCRGSSWPGSAWRARSPLCRS